MRAVARLGLLTLTLALGSPAAKAAGNLFCCIDAYGKQVCGDILPRECVGRAYRELGDNGRTLRTVEAPLTGEQRIQRAAEEERQKAEEAALREKQRKDQALLNTYGNEKDIEMMRQRALDDVQKSIKAAEAKIVEIRTLRKKYENEAEFYVKRTLPTEVQKGLRDTDAEIKGQEAVIESKKKEIDSIRLKYDDDRRRYLEISRRASVR